MKRARLFTTINYVLSSILWLLGILTLLYNLLGRWQPWHLAGFGFIFCFPCTALFQILALYFSRNLAQKKYMTMNLISLAVSVGVVLFTLLVSATWFW